MPTFEMDGRHIYFESHGQGRPLVLLNGIMMSCVSWQPFIEALSANNRLILVDFLDQGKSEKMVGQTYDHGIQVQVVRRLLEHLNLQSACVAGISYGSEVALEFAVTYPEMTEVCFLIFTVFTLAIIFAGVRNGVERVSKLMMPVPVVFLSALARCEKRYLFLWKWIVP